MEDGNYIFGGLKIREPYAEVAINQIPRLLSLVDKNEFSKTFGCFDRTYWHYKINDFPCARLQEACLTLALIYTRNFPKNPWYNNELIKELTIGSITFWCKIQHKDGSFDEWYPKEHSHVATCFSTYAIAEAIRLLLNVISKKDLKKFLAHLNRAADWLIKNDDYSVMNHQAGSALALLTVYELTNKKEYLKAALKKSNLVIKAQSREGWFSEYGAVDTGYLTLFLYYLSIFYEKTKDKTLIKPLERAVRFISYFIHPDLSFGGEYNSRDTNFYIPTGFEILAYEIPLARRIGDLYLHALKGRKILAPYSEDDRYICYDLYRYLQAYDFYKKNSKEEKLPFEKEESFFKFFSDAKLLVVKINDYYSLVGGSKGGVIKIFNIPKKALVYSDCGFVGIDKSSVFGMHKLDSSLRITVDSLNKEIEIQAKLSKIHQKYSNLKRKILFYVSLNVIETLRLSNFIKNIMRTQLIHKKSENIAKIHREIKFYDKTILVIDKIVPYKNVKLKKLKIFEKYSWIFSASTNQFDNFDHFSFKIRTLDTSKLSTLTKGGLYEISREIDPMDNTVKWFIKIR